MDIALNKSKSKDCGLDEIPCCFLENLGITAKNHLLNFYSRLWRTWRIPNGWKKGIIISIIKPNKNKHSVDKYRPITLLNTMTKTLEKIINTKLVWYPEINKILSIEQSCFRRARSTIDNLYIIKSEINKALENKQILGMISLDITKA